MVSKESVDDLTAEERTVLIACLAWQCEAGHDSWSNYSISKQPHTDTVKGWADADVSTHALLRKLSRTPDASLSSNRELAQREQKTNIIPNVKSSVSASTSNNGQLINIPIPDIEQGVVATQISSSTNRLSTDCNARPPLAPIDALTQAEHLALACDDLQQLEQTALSCNLCSLHLGARNGVFADGNPKASLMIVGEAPGKEEDEQGKPFVGASGQLLMRMLSHIGITDRLQYYITNLVYWRPPGNRPPTSDELLVCHPFFKRQIALVQPRLLLLLGNVAARTILREKNGITRLRGKFLEYNIEPAYMKTKSANDTKQGKDSTPFCQPIRTLATFHPSYLLRTPIKKSATWHDLLMLRHALQDSIMAKI